MELDGGGDGGGVVGVEGVGGRAALTVHGGVLRAFGGRGAREDVEEEDERGRERSGALGDEEMGGVRRLPGERVGVVAVVRGDEAGAGGAVEGGLVGGADLREADGDLAEVLLGGAEGDEVAVGGRGRAAAARGAEAERGRG